MNHWLKENRGFIVFLICYGLFRTAVADWNPIPSGSMRPNLLEGDVVLVNRLAYDIKLPLTDVVVAHLAEPKRGDIVTFSSPKDGTRLIKRIVAVPGDRVEMRREVLLVNGQAAEYSDPVLLQESIEHKGTVQALRLTEIIGDERRRIQLLAAVPAINSFPSVEVPPKHYLMLGDNRDNSGDSRYFGFVPRELLIGRAHHILASADINGNWLPRWERFGRPLQ